MHPEINILFGVTLNDKSGTGAHFTEMKVEEERGKRERKIVGIDSFFLGVSIFASFPCFSICKTHIG
jgi:hypothetical protein